MTLHYFTYSVLETITNPILFTSQIILNVDGNEFSFLLMINFWHGTRRGCNLLLL